MRKVFWCCAATTVLVAGSVYLAAKHVDRHPYVAVAELTASVCGITPTVEPCPGVPADGGVPADPTPADVPATSSAPVAPNPVVAVTEPTLRGEIDVAGEGSTSMPAVREATPVGEEMTSDTSFVTSSGSTLVGYVVGETSASCPNVMPYCTDSDSASRGRMPYADEDQGEEGAANLLDICLDLFEKVLSEVFEPLDEDGNTVQPGEEMPADQGQEGKNYHHHHMSCPYTGRCYQPSYVPSPAVPDTNEKKSAEEKDDIEEIGKRLDGEEPKKADEEQEKKTEESKPEKQSDGENPELPPSLSDLDTMEFRPSDAGLEHFIPGPV